MAFTISFDINNEIKANKVRIITDEGIDELSLKDAIKKAKSLDMDLIQVNVDGDIAICKIADYKHFIYSREKKNKKNKQKGSTLKEVRFNWKIGNHDLEVKVNTIRRIIFKDKDKVRVTIQFRGREVQFINDGFNLVNRIKDILKNTENSKYISNSNLRFSEPKQLGSSIVFDIEGVK